MTSQKNGCDSDEYVATFSDFKHICKRSWRKIIYISLAFAALGLLFALSRPVLYPIKASFKEMGKSKGSEAGGSIGIILGGVTGSQHSDAITWMESSKLMKRVIKTLDLQGTIQPKYGSSAMLTTMWNNIKTEYSLLSKKTRPGHRSEYRPLKVTHVDYDGEVPISFEIDFIDESHYSVTGSDGTIIGQGELDAPFTGDDVSFTLEKNESTIPQVTYTVAFQPLDSLAEALQKRMKIDTDKTDKDLVLITFFYPNRFVGTEIVNRMMTLYKEHQVEEQRRITDSQIAYLEKRQHEARKSLESTMERLVQEQASDVESSGFPNSTHALEFLGASQKEQYHKIMMIDLEIQRLKKVAEEGCAYYDRLHHDGGDAAIINSLLSEMRSLKQQADAINLSLHQYLPETLEDSNHTFAKQMAKLEETQKTLSELKALVTALEQDSLLQPTDKLFKDPRFMIQSWYDKMAEYQEERHWGRLNEDEWNKHKEQYLVYLNNLVQLYRVQEKAIKERIAQHGDVKDEFQGITLQMAKDLFLENNKQLSALDAEILQYQFVIEKLQDPEFSVNSLQTILSDPISGTIISNYSNLLFALKDQGHRSEKEQERIKNELLLQRNFLAMHLSQTLQIKTLTADLIRKRIYTLQNLSLALIQQQVSLLEKQLQDYISDRIANLSQERTVISASTSAIKKEMAKLPKRWYAEQIIGQQLEMNRNFGKEITQLVESKNINTNLEVVKSTPVDIAVAPVFPKKPHLLLFAIAGAIAGALFSMITITAREALRGLRASEENLRELKMHVSGTVSNKHFSCETKPIHDKALETLRKVIDHLYRTPTENSPTNNAVAVIGIDNPNFAKDLAALVAMKGLKVLLIPLTFNNESKYEKEGLLQYLEGEADTPKITQLKSFDCVMPGGASRFGPELISSTRFTDLLKTYCQKYDWVLCHSEAKITSAEGQSLANMYDNLCVCLDEETIEDLTNIRDLEKQEPNKRVTSVFYHDDS